MIRASLGLLLGALWALPLQADTLIHAGQIFVGNSDKLLGNHTLRVKAERLVSVTVGFEAPTSDDVVIDLKTMTVLPGLMDTHVHLRDSYSQKSNLNRFTLGDADFALKGYANGMLTLRAGFTTVRDLGDNGRGVIALRKAIAAGIVNGPRILAAGKTIGTTGGHSDPSNGYKPAIAGDPGPREGVANGPDDMRKAVRQRYKEGSDWIKITATGGVLSVAKNGQNPQFSTEELEALIETANDYDLPVAAHAHGAEGMKRAIIAGVKSIEHGTFMSEEIIRLMKRNGTYYVPTILAGEWVAEKSKIDGFFPALVRPKAATIGPQIKQTFAKAQAAGVNIVFGTDTGVSPHGENAREFALMVEAGMSRADALQSATRVAAEFLGLDDDLGTLEAGKIADVVAVSGNPLTDIAVMEKVEFVMQAGQVVNLSR